MSALPFGTPATVKGTVTVPSGSFASSTFDQGFAFQDNTGRVFVSVQHNLQLKLGNLAEVT